MKVKLLIFILLLTLTLSSCSNNNEEKLSSEESFKASSTTIQYIKINGKQINSTSIGLSTEFFSFYSNNPDLEVNSSTFELEKAVKQDCTNISVQSYDGGTLIECGFDFESEVFGITSYKVNKIELDTNCGIFYVNPKYESVDLEIDSSKYSDIFRMGPKHELSISEMNPVDSSNYPSLNCRLEILTDDVLIKDIELANKEYFPSDLIINDVFLNGVKFEKNSDFIYNESPLNINVNLNKFYIGDYNFKITYVYNNTENFIYTAPQSIFYFMEDFFPDTLESYKEFYRYYRGADLTYEMQKEN